ncbi:MFS transporter [Nocardiopsis sp. JB363]|uniref:MFS transporter n=1 Tax=Nocardiopsis sp. JB363 TaxID=1434837 RepID=UPI000B3545B3|nr:MFS transporter [Nocardiopsis sp. JB363]
MSSPVRAPSYASVLRVTGVARFFAPALLGRASYGMVSLALVLSVVHATGSYADVGLVTGLFGLTVTVLSPLRARLIDRHGTSRALLPMAVLHACALLGLAVTTWNPGGALGTLAALTVLAGAGAPPLGPVTRTIWSHVVADRGLLQRAYSLDTVAEETLFFTGPLILGALMWVAPPSAGLALSGVLILVGTVGLATSTAARSLTPPRPDAPGDPRPTGARRPDLVSRTGFLAAVALSAVMGLTLGSTALLNVAFAEQRGAVEAVVLVEAAQSAGSALGGLAYGAVIWRAGARARSALLGLGLGVGVAVAALMPGVPALVALLFVVGAFTAPLIITTYLLADESVGAGYRTRAGNWVNTAYNAGSSLGAAAVGMFLTVASPNGGFLLAGAVLVVVAVIVFLTGGRVRPAAGNAPSAR